MICFFKNYRNTMSFRYIKFHIKIFDFISYFYIIYKIINKIIQTNIYLNKLSILQKNHKNNFLIK